MNWMKKIGNFIMNITKRDILECTMTVLFLWALVCYLQTNWMLNKYKEKLSNYRSVLVNELCNEGQGNYDFCILKKAEYTFVEKSKNPEVKPAEKDEVIETLKADESVDNVTVNEEEFYAE